MQVLSSDVIRGRLTNAYNRLVRGGVLWLCERKAGEEGTETGWITVNGRPLYVGTETDAPKPAKPKIGSDKKKIQYKAKDGTQAERWSYDKKWTDQSDKYKFARMASMAQNSERIKKVLRWEMEGDEPSEKKAVATAALMMRLSGMRASSGSGGKTEGKTTFGATTLQRRHVSIDGDTVTFKFRGKAGVMQNKKITDKDLVASVRVFMGGADRTPGDKTPLFAYKSPRGTNRVLRRQKVVERLKKWDDRYLSKDLRTLVANEHASAKVQNMITRKARFKNEREKKRKARLAVKELAEFVSKRLGNQPQMALRKYIHPGVVEYMLQKKGLA